MMNKYDITGLAVRRAPSYHLHHCTVCKIQNGQWGQEKVFGLFHQLLLKRFFDLSTPSMQKVDDKENGEKRKYCRACRLTTVYDRYPKVSINI